MEKRLFVQLNGNRKVIGILRGYDVRGKLLNPLDPNDFALKEAELSADQATK
jgi:hypothetical protein